MRRRGALYESFFSVRNVCPIPERQPGSVQAELKAPPVPVIYQEATLSELEKMSLRTYAAIHLRVPESGIDWVDKMIERSRKLDRKSR